MAPPIRVDGPSAPAAAAFLDDRVLYESAPLHGASYSYSVIEVGRDGPPMDVISLPDCGVATMVSLGDTGDLAVHCSLAAIPDFVLLAGLRNSHVQIQTDGEVRAFAAGPKSDTLAIALLDGRIIMSNLEGKVLNTWHLPDRLQVPLGALGASGASIVVGAGPGEIASQGLFDQLIVIDVLSGAVEQIDLEASGTSLTVTRAGPWVTDQEGCVRVYETDSYETRERWCDLGNAMRVIPTRP